MMNDADASSSNVSVLGIQLSYCSFTQIMREMDAAIRHAQFGRYIAITNTESMYHALQRPSHQAYINAADFSCCDGIGVVAAGALLGHRIPRLHGPDLMQHCCRYGIDRKWRHFLYGGRQDVLEMLTQKLKLQHPGLIIAGTCSPPFRKLTPQEDRDIVRMISEARPDILWVGLGLLKQERWISAHLDTIRVPWMIGVGAAFDFHAGSIKRAPLAFQKVGLEWLYRVAFEPRMIKRNLYSLLLFLPAIREYLKRKRIQSHQ
jgi:N-acetylglucosaminyldiphosphoundecaprenol N-acetyl-beta-D-mannosaminyltransferase